MSEAEELKKVRQSLDRLVAAMEASPLVGKSYQVRAGRGGNSNGSTAQAAVERVENDRSKLSKSTEKLEIAIRDASRTSALWRDSVNKMSGAQAVFGETLNQTISRIDAANSKQSMSSRKLTEANVKLVKQYGLQSDAIRGAVEKTFSFAEAMAKLKGKQEDRARIESIGDEISELKKQRNAENKKKARQRNDELINAIDAEIASLQAFAATLPDVQKDIEALSAEAVALHAAARGLSPALDEVSASAITLTDVNGKQELTVEGVTEITKTFGEKLDTTVHTLDELNKDALANFSKGMEQARESMLTAVKSIGKTLGGALPQIIDNFRDQLRYNVKESNYIAAAEMGMSDGELSRALGENAHTFRGITGSGDNRAILDGTLQNLQRTVTSLYGEAGPEAMKRIAQTAQMSQGAGISTRGNPAIIEQNLKSFSSMADRLGMVKGDLMDFAAGLAEGGELAYLAGKYQHMNASDAQSALNRELEARIANAKMLGLGTEHIKAQIQLERKNRYGTMENQIQNMIGGKMDASFARKNGVAVSSELEGIISKQAMGRKLTADEQSQYAQYQLASQSAMESGMARADAAGDNSALFGFGVQRSMSGKFGSDMYSEESMVRAEKQRAEIRARYSEEEWAEFEKNGTVAKMYQQNGLNAGDAGSFNSSLMIGDQFMNAGKTVWDGITKNPLMTGIAAGVAIIAYNTTKMAMLSGLGVKDVLKHGGKTAANVARGALNAGGGAIRAGGASGMGRAGGAALGKIGLGNAGNFARVAAGGMMGAGIGIAGSLVDSYGTGMKAEGVQSGDLTNDTVFDKATAGASMSIAGKSLSYGATGAMIGSIIPGVGTAIGGAIGAVVGAGMGVVDNFDVIKSNFNTVTDGLTENTAKMIGTVIPAAGVAMAAFDAITGPSETLEKTASEAAKERAKNPSAPTEVVITGAQGEAIIKSGENSEKISEAAKQQVGEQKKANEFRKTAGDIKAMLDAQKANVIATEQRFANLDNT